MIAAANMETQRVHKRPINAVLSSDGYINAMKQNAEKKAAAELKKQQNREKRLANAQKNVQQAQQRLERIQKKAI